MHRRQMIVGLAGLSAMGLIGPRMAAAGQGWPRQFTNSDGTQTRIEAQPQRILSTAVTLTGTLLALKAPVVASAATTAGHFFNQWADAAEEADVARLWAAGQVDLEAAYELAPDLVVISSGGADSALAERNQLARVAPCIVLDYSDASWQEVAAQLAEGLGLEAQLRELLADYDNRLDHVRGAITRPEGTASIVSFNGPAAPNPIARRDSVHGQLLEALGFRIDDPDPAWGGAGAASSGFIRSSYEHLTELQSDSIFLVAAGNDRAEAFLADPLLAKLPAVRNRQVWALGPDSFRIDPYSAWQVIDRVADIFGQGT